MADSAKGFVEVVEKIINQAFIDKDKTSICLVESVNADGTVNIFLLPDMQTVIKNVVNESNYIFKTGDTAVLYTMKGDVANSFLLAKFNPQPNELRGGGNSEGTGTIIVSGGGGKSSYTLPIASTEILGGIKVGQGLSITGDGTLSVDETGRISGELKDDKHLYLNFGGVSYDMGLAERTGGKNGIGTFLNINGTDTPNRSIWAPEDKPPESGNALIVYLQGSDTPTWETEPIWNCGDSTINNN